MVASADRVRVSWEGTGTGTATLGAAISLAFIAPPSALNGQTVSYLIEHQGEGITQVEWGRGVYSSSGGTLTRAQVVGSTNGGFGGSLVNFSAGIKHISITLLADDLAGRFISTLTEATIDGTNDYLVFWDATDQLLKKVLPNNLPGGGGGGGSGSAIGADGSLPSVVNFATPVAWNVSTQPHGVLTLTGDTTLNATGIVDGVLYLLRVVQDGTGGRELSMGTGFTAAAWPVSDGPAIKTGANAQTWLFVVGMNGGLVPPNLSLLKSLAFSDPTDVSISAFDGAGALASLSAVGASEITPGVITHSHLSTSFLLGATETAQPAGRCVRSGHAAEPLWRARCSAGQPRQAAVAVVANATTTCRTGTPTPTARR